MIRITMVDTERPITIRVRGNKDDLYAVLWRYVDPPPTTEIEIQFRELTYTRPLPFFMFCNALVADMVPDTRGTHVDRIIVVDPNETIKTMRHCRPVGRAFMVVVAIDGFNFNLSRVAELLYLVDTESNFELLESALILSARAKSNTEDNTEANTEDNTEDNTHFIQIIN